MLKVRIFPNNDDLLHLDTICSRNNSKLQIGGATHCDYQVEGLTSVDDPNWCVAYINCEHISDVENIKVELLNHKRELVNHVA